MGFLDFMCVFFGQKLEKKNSRIGLELNYAKNLGFTQKYNFLVDSLCVEIVQLCHKAFCERIVSEQFHICVSF